MSNTDTKPMSEVEELMLRQRVEVLEEQLDTYRTAYLTLYAKLPVLLAEFEQEVIRETLAAVEEGDSR